MKRNGIEVEITEIEMKVDLIGINPIIEKTKKFEEIEIVTGKEIEIEKRTEKEGIEKENIPEEVEVVQIEGEVGIEIEAGKEMIHEKKKGKIL